MLTCHVIAAEPAPALAVRLPKISLVLYVIIFRDWGFRNRTVGIIFGTIHPKPNSHTTSAGPAYLWE